MFVLLLRPLTTLCVDPTTKRVGFPLPYPRLPVMDRADLDRLLQLLATVDGSDLHIKAGPLPASG